MGIRTTKTLETNCEHPDRHSRPRYVLTHPYLEVNIQDQASDRSSPAWLNHSSLCFTGGKVADGDTGKRSVSFFLVRLRPGH